MLRREPVPSRNLDELPPWATQMLDSARVGRLGLLDDRMSPRVLPVTFALACGDVFTAADEKRKSVPPHRLARLRFLRARPQAALTVDHYEDDWSKLAWVQVLGRGEVLDADESPVGLRALCDKYEQYRDRPPPGPLVRLTVERALCWRSGGTELA